MGLERAAPTSWAWIEVGLDVLEELGVGQLLEAGEEEGHPHEQPEGHQEPPGGHRSVRPGDRPHAGRARCPTRPIGSPRPASALEALPVTGSIPWPGTIQAVPVQVDRRAPDVEVRGAVRPTPVAAVGRRTAGCAYHGPMDQLVVAPGGPRRRRPSGRRPTRPCAACCGCPSDQAPIDESETHRIFSASIFLSALRCLLTYIVLPVVLPAIGVARGVGPAIGIPIGVLALTFDYLGHPPLLAGRPPSAVGVHRPLRRGRRDGAGAAHRGHRRRHRLNPGVTGHADRRTEPRGHPDQRRPPSACLL